MSVSVNLGPYVLSDIPLFYVIVASLLVGLILSYLIHLVHHIAHTLVVRGKESEIKKNRETIAELTKRIHQLELENKKYKPKNNLEPEDRNAL